MQVVRVSGTIKKAEEEAIRRARAAILKAKRESENDAEGLLGFLGEGKARSAGITNNIVKANSDDSDGEDEMAMDSDEDG